MKGLLPHPPWSTATTPDPQWHHASGHETLGPRGRASNSSSQQIWSQKMDVNSVEV